MAEKPGFGGSMSGNEKAGRPESPGSDTEGALQEGPSGSGPRREAGKAQVGGEMGGIGGTTPQHGSKDLPGGSPGGPAKQSSGCFGSILALAAVVLLASNLI